MLSSCPSRCVRALGRALHHVLLTWSFCCSQAQRRRQRCFWATLVLGIVMFVVHVCSDLSLTAWILTGLAPCPDNSSSRDDSEFYVPYPHHYSLIIDEPVRCQQGAPFLVLMVPVAPGDRTSRDAIRRTWGGLRSVRGREVQQYFLLGSTAEGTQTDQNQSLQQQIIEESRLYHDILQSDFVDSYLNLTVKTMLMFTWLHSHCPSSAYAMKVDSDIFLNVPNLMELLLDAPRRSFVTGLVFWFGSVERNQNSKWYLPCWVFPEKYYPPYVLGLGYVFSMDMPQRIVNVSAGVKAIYIEDVYVGLCLRELGVVPSDPPYDHLFMASMPFFRSPCYWANVITTIIRDSEQLLETWEEYQKQLGSC